MGDREASLAVKVARPSRVSSTQVGCRTTDIRWLFIHFTVYIYGSTHSTEEFGTFFIRRPECAIRSHSHLRLPSGVTRCSPTSTARIALLLSTWDLPRATFSTPWPGWLASPPQLRLPPLMLRRRVAHRPEQQSLTTMVPLVILTAPVSAVVLVTQWLDLTRRGIRKLTMRLHQSQACFLPPTVSAVST